MSSSDRDEHVVRPGTNEIAFGFFPEIRVGPNFFPEGEIRLLKGEHREKNRGYGLNHILIAHGADIERFGFTNDVRGAAEYVAAIVTPGAKIYTEFGDPGGKHRAQIAASSKLGIVVLEQRPRRSDPLEFYSVVTAYPTKAKGTLIGALR